MYLFKTILASILAKHLSEVFTPELHDTHCPCVN